MEATRRLQNLRSILRHDLKPLSGHSHILSSPVTSKVSHTSAHPMQPSINTTPQQRCRITVIPQVTQFDETPRVRVSGLDRHGMVTVQGWVRSEWRGKEVVFVSHGHCHADQEGNLDLATDPALAGTYTGVDPAGLFWSMRPLPGHAQDVRLVIRDVSKPVVLNIAVFEGHVTPDDDTVAMTSLKPLCMTSVQRRILAAGVRRVEIWEGRVRGTLFLPPGDGAHPGVIDMFGAAGGIMEVRAALLAAHGFVALSLAFFGYQDLPSKMNDVQFDYFEEAVAWFSQHTAVRAGGIGVAGVSVGARIAMLMAIHCPQIRAVVEINGTPFQIFSSCLRHGQVLQPPVRTDMSKVVKLQTEGFITRDAYVVTDDDYFPVWKSSARLLCLVSQDDQQTAWEHARRLRDLYPRHKRHLIDLVVYPEAGHLLEPPFTPHCRYCYNPAAMDNVVWGGSLRPMP